MVREYVLSSKEVLGTTRADYRRSPGPSVISHGQSSPACRSEISPETKGRNESGLLVLATREMGYGAAGAIKLG